MFSNNLFSALNAYQSSSLESPFSPEETKKLVWNCDGDIAQGPDGLSFAFIKIYSEILGTDIIGAIFEFHATACLHYIYCEG